MDSVRGSGFHEHGVCVRMGLKMESGFKIDKLSGGNNKYTQRCHFSAQLRKNSISGSGFHNGGVCQRRHGLNWFEIYQINWRVYQMINIWKAMCTECYYSR